MKAKCKWLLPLRHLPVCPGTLFYNREFTVNALFNTWKRNIVFSKTEKHSTKLMCYSVVEGEMCVCYQNDCAVWSSSLDMQQTLCLLLLKQFALTNVYYLDKWTSCYFIIQIPHLSSLFWTWLMFFLHLSILCRVCSLH